jgi:hypothetical protein
MTGLSPLGLKKLMIRLSPSLIKAEKSGDLRSNSSLGLETGENKKETGENMEKRLRLRIDWLAEHQKFQI